MLRITLSLSDLPMGDYQVMRVTNLDRGVLPDETNTYEVRARTGGYYGSIEFDQRRRIEELAIEALKLITHT